MNSDKKPLGLYPWGTKSSTKHPVSNRSQLKDLYGLSLDTIMLATLGVWTTKTGYLADVTYRVENGKLCIVFSYQDPEYAKVFSKFTSESDLFNSNDTLEHFMMYTMKEAEKYFKTGTIEEG